jgi:hypothetical protein
VFIVCDKKVRYSDAKKKELHVFPQPASSDDSGESICRSEWLADQVLERIRERMTSVKDELKRGESIRYPRFLLKFSAQKSASSVNF